MSDNIDVTREIMKSPIITVLMPVYNGEIYLREAIESILNQTFTFFEFLIVNDGSTDNSENIILSYTDRRIRYIKNDENLKLIATLNKGLNQAQGKYIARMDADDISMFNRLELQLKFMESHPEIGLLGSNILEFSNDVNKSTKIKFKETHHEIKFKLFFDTHFPHPAAFIRKSILDKYNLNFNLDCLHAEDYDLWNRIAKHTQLHILQDYLVAKRTHEDQISKVHRRFQIDKVDQIRMNMISEIFSIDEEKLIGLFTKYINGQLPKSKKETRILLEYISYLFEKNREKKHYNNELWESFCQKAFWHILSSNTKFGIEFYFTYRDHNLIIQQNLSKSLRFKWFIKSFLNVSISQPKIFYAEQ
jgi:glycosyltransferase involved in cell wall biosynthesis